MILLTCDEESLTKLAVTNLTKWGFNVSAFSSGRETITFLRRFGTPVDALIVDSDLPYMEIEDYLKSVRSDTIIGQDTPILVIHTSDDPHDISKAYEAGATKVITKPFGMSELQDFVVKAKLTPSTLKDSA